MNEMSVGKFGTLLLISLFVFPFVFLFLSVFSFCFFFSTFFSSLKRKENKKKKQRKCTLLYIIKLESNSCLDRLQSSTKMKHLHNDICIQQNCKMEVFSLKNYNKFIGKCAGCNHEYTFLNNSANRRGVGGCSFPFLSCFFFFFLFFFSFPIINLVLGPLYPLPLLFRLLSIIHLNKSKFPFTSQAHIVEPTPGNGFVINCDINTWCSVPLYVSG